MLLFANSRLQFSLLRVECGISASSARLRSEAFAHVGSCAMVSLWTGRYIQSESSMMRSVKPSKPGEGYGQAACRAVVISGVHSGERKSVPLDDANAHS